MPKVVHFEFTAKDPERAVSFYQNVFGWQVTKWDGPEDYWLLTTGPKEEEGINGAIMREPGETVRTINTIGVPSVDEYLAKVEAHGGKVLMPKSEIPGVGFFANCQDPEGNIFGIIEFSKSE
jgi:predicted enzyme related to lactoylglutathione lyase